MKIECNAKLGGVGAAYPFRIDVDEQDIEDMTPDERENFLWEAAKDYAIENSILEITIKDPL